MIWKRKELKEEGVAIRRCYLAAGFFIPLVILVLAVIFPGGCARKQPVAIPAVEQEIQAAPEVNLASEKISLYARPEALMSVYELQENTFDTAMIIFDTRGRTYNIYQKTYLYGHIPGAVPFIFSQFYNQPYPGRLGSPSLLEDILERSCVSNSTCIVIYGTDGSDARLYWALRMYGYDSVKILDGGLDKWKDAGFETTTAIFRRSAASFKFDFTNSKAEQMLATLKEVNEAVGSDNCVIVDTRTDGEYSKGHIPGSVNVPWGLLLNQDMTFKPAPQLRELFENKNVIKDKKVIVYSNAGFRSSLVWFVLSELLGYPNVKNYDGSLNEWKNHELTVATGLPK